MFIVTGGAGFIGSNVIKLLNKRGHKNILVVDSLKEEGQLKVANLAALDILDFEDRETYLKRIQNSASFGKVEAVFHFGGESSTTESDGDKVMRWNYAFSKTLLAWCGDKKTPLIYASSASVYGVSTDDMIELYPSKPRNLYAWSKAMFDQWVLQTLSAHKESYVYGLRIFNAYGPGEFHKNGQASPVYAFNRQLLKGGKIKLFDHPGREQGVDYCRDFVHVYDVAKVAWWMYEQKPDNGIYNVGTGKAVPFTKVADRVIEFHGKGEKDYVPFPDNLKGRYQPRTCADLTLLRGEGYTEEFIPADQGIKHYLEYLNERKDT